MKKIAIPAYLILLLPAFWLAAVVWEKVAVGKLFYCGDTVGVPGDFLPPFVHSQPGDYYVTAAWIVHLVWVLHLFAAFGLPGCLLLLAVNIFTRLEEESS